MSKKAKNRIIISVLCAVVVFWSIAFVTDYVRASSLKAPIFVVASGATVEDGGSRTYYGLGYSVHVGKYADDECGSVINSVEMRMFGKVIAASVT